MDCLPHAWKRWIAHLFRRAACLTHTFMFCACSHGQGCMNRLSNACEFVPLPTYSSFSLGVDRSRTRLLLADVLVCVEPFRNFVPFVQHCCFHSAHSPRVEDCLHKLSIRCAVLPRYTVRLCPAPSSARGPHRPTYSLIFPHAGKISRNSVCCSPISLRGRERVRRTDRSGRSSYVEKRRFMPHGVSGINHPNSTTLRTAHATTYIQSSRSKLSVLYLWRVGSMVAKRCGLRG